MTTEIDVSMKTIGKYQFMKSRGAEDCFFSAWETGNEESAVILSFSETIKLLEWLGAWPND